MHEALYRYDVSWEAFSDSSDIYFLFAEDSSWSFSNTVLLYNIFRHIFLSNYLSPLTDILHEALFRYDVLWDAFSDSSDIYFLFDEDLELCTTILTVLIGLERGYH